MKINVTRLVGANAMKNSATGVRSETGPASAVRRAVFTNARTDTHTGARGHDPARGFAQPASVYVRKHGGLDQPDKQEGGRYARRKNRVNKFALVFLWLLYRRKSRPLFQPDSRLLNHARPLRQMCS